MAGDNGSLIDKRPSIPFKTYVENDFPIYRKLLREEFSCSPIGKQV